MNNFAALDPQTPECELATVQPGEVYTEENAQPETRKPRVNGKKLAFYNLGKPLASRLSHSALQAKAIAAKHRGNVMGVWATIHAEVEPARQAIRDAWADFRTGKRLLVR